MCKTAQIEKLQNITFQILFMRPNKFVYFDNLNNVLKG
jgi:hypothetical protein